jgi:hypothetical protein
MNKGSELLDALIQNSHKIRACDFSKLDHQATDTAPVQKLTGSLMTKKKKQTGSTGVSYTFAL